MKAKKFLIIGLALVLSIGLVGCNNNNDDQNQSGDNQVVSGDSGEVNSGEQGNTLISGEASEVGDDNDITESTADVMTKIVEDAKLEVMAPMQDAIPAEVAQTFVGLTTEVFNEYIDSSVYYESQMSPSNQSYCLVKVKNFDDVKMIKDTIFENADARKWICMSADRVVVSNAGKYVLLAMGSTESCDSMLNAFADYFDGKVGTTLDRFSEDYQAELEAQADMNAE